MYVTLLKLLAAFINTVDYNLKQYIQKASGKNKLLNGSILHLVHQTHRPYYFYVFSTTSNISLSLNVPNNGASSM
ncbi:hypothetical protein T06_12026, partial [Trichinella sp. T6]